jgi:ABC-type branched-subunit amino acid transport system substrate-binding protein
MPRVLLALGLVGTVAAGCGARWSETQHAKVEGRGARGPAPAAAGPGTDVVDASPIEVDLDGAVAPGPGVAPTSGPVVAVGPSGPRPCAAPSTAPGVTDAEIAVGAINTLSGPVPGLGATYEASTRAYVAYRNATGGVCGRRIKLLAFDDGADNARYRAAVDSLSSRAISVVTGIAAGGDGGVDLYTQRGIPVVGTGITPRLEVAPTYFGVRPLLPSYDVVLAKYRYLFDQGVRKAAIVYVSAASSPAEGARHHQLMQAAGIQVVLDLAVPLTTLSWDSTARAVANSGADYLFYVYEQGASAAMARAVDDIGLELKYEEYIVAYGSQFIDLAGPAAAEGTSSWIDTLPIEDGGALAEQAAYMTWMRRTSPESALDPFAALSWSASKALFDSLEALPGPITREALMAQLQGNHAYDAGGLLAPIDLGAKRSQGCLVGMVVRNGTWTRMHPQQGFLC